MNIPTKVGNENYYYNEILFITLILFTIYYFLSILLIKPYIIHYRSKIRASCQRLPTPTSSGTTPIYREISPCFHILRSSIGESEHRANHVCDNLNCITGKDKSIKDLSNHVDVSSVFTSKQNVRSCYREQLDNFSNLANGIPKVIPLPDIYQKQHSQFSNLTGLKNEHEQTFTNRQLYNQDIVSQDSFLYKQIKEKKDYIRSCHGHDSNMKDTYRSAFISAASPGDLSGRAGEVAEDITPLGYSGGYERKIRLSPTTRSIDIPKSIGFDSSTENYEKVSHNVEGSLPGSVNSKKLISWDNVKNLPIDETILIIIKLGEFIRTKLPTFPKWPEGYPIIPTSKGKCSSIGENCCIIAMEWLFPGYFFTKIRPSWLKNPKTKRNLELDGYCEQLKMAIEYNGIQHYNWPNFCGQTLEDFTSQRYRDILKYKLCVTNNVYLLHVPYTVPSKQIPIYIYVKLLNSVPL